MEKKEAYKIDLMQLFDNVKDLLQWAETKHGVIIGIDAASLIALAAILTSSVDNTKCIIKFAAIIAIILFLAALIISLVSFFPRLNTDKKRGNLIFLKI